MVLSRLRRQRLLTRVRRQKVYFPLLNSLDYLDEFGIYERYRFDKSTILWITTLLEDDLKTASRRSRAIPPVIQVLPNAAVVSAGVHPLSFYFLYRISS